MTRDEKLEWALAGTVVALGIGAAALLACGLCRLVY